MLILKNWSFTTLNFCEALFSQLSSYCCVVQYWAGMMTSCNAAAGGRIIETDLQAPSVNCLVVQACNSNATFFPSQNSAESCPTHPYLQ